MLKLHEMGDFYKKICTFAENMWKNIKKYPLSFTLIIFIWVLCIIPIPENTPLSGFNLIDKWTHFVMYGVLSLVICLEGKRISWYSILIPTLMGGFIELAQAYLTTCRSGEWADLIADAIGVLLGNLLYWVYKIIKR